MTQFGKTFREKYFSTVLPDIYAVNHGSYGVTPDPIIDKFVEALKHDFGYRDRFIRFEQQTEYRVALEALGEFLSVDYHNLALTTNTTTGVNAILRSLPFEKGDKIVVHSTTYGSCRNTVEFLKSRIGIEVFVVKLDYPIENDEILRRFEEVLLKEKPKLVMFDGISSMPSARLPFEKLTKLTAKYGALSLVDGAHVIGQIPVNISDFSPDFFVTNLHKWLFVPLGCSVVYVDPKHHRALQTLPISHSYVPDTAALNPETEKNLLVNKFAFTGTTTFGQISVIPEAIKFRREVCGGEKKIYDYCTGLARQVGQKVAAKWNTSYITNSDDTLVTSLVNVEIPIQEIGLDLEVLTKNYVKLEESLETQLAYDQKTYVPIVIHNGKLYARFSCQIYTEFSDFEYASDKLIEGLKKLVASDLYKETAAEVNGKSRL